MPESSAVYQPTTVGYAYDNGRDPRITSGLRSSFSRLFSRHKFSSRKWLEWLLLSVSFCIFVAGLTELIVHLASDDDSTMNKAQDTEKKTPPVKDATTEVEEHVGSGSSGSLAVGATMMFFGLFLGIAWVWLRFFRRSKSPRGGLSGGGGQYGPVLTELPSQIKLKSSEARETPVTLPLSDQEEETHTLMQEPSSPPTASGGNNVVITSQIPG
ncbi:uncharacterized protein LOC122499556 isoform X2 [Leptopilina heterotoma]|uniref:uncharacterized protein LOC122499556 isoform X2 n=1 Tax=Leptopilina heterotoma TaxID=63436 RepID=UPI001CAA24D5|nr:uncharacterized protein LOC122499556 isoform X2 [Leptopilina heterotoma]